jgi:hypothetical protein
MNWRWEESGGWWMCTASPHFVRGRQYVGCSAIRRPASCGLSGGEKTVCGVCGQASRRIYDRKLRWVRDLSAGDTRIYLEIEYFMANPKHLAKLQEGLEEWNTWTLAERTSGKLTFSKLSLAIQILYRHESRRPEKQMSDRIPRMDAKRPAASPEIPCALWRPACEGSQA